MPDRTAVHSPQPRDPNAVHHVHASTEVPVGMAFDQVSVPGLTVTIMIAQDPPYGGTRTKPRLQLVLERPFEIHITQENHVIRAPFRSEGRRVGKESVSTCSSRGSPYH